MTTTPRGAADSGRHVAQRKIQMSVALLVVAAGLLLAAAIGGFAYLTITAVPLHRSAQDVSSVTRSAPRATWTAAVKQARQIVRTALTEQNLPGVSVAVGIGDEIVWAEGFGWADLEHRIPVAPEMRFR